MSQKLASYGQWTYRGAWALEIAASIIGLLTGLALGYQAFDASESGTAMELVLASAPFFIVAIAELTKIPVATLLFTVSWPWKPIVLAFLMALATITFLTVILGLERAGTLQELKYEELTGKIKILQDERANLDASDQAAMRSDAEAKARANLEDINALAEKERKEVKARVDAIDDELLAATALSPAAARAKGLLDEKGMALAELIDRRDREIRDAVAQFESQRDSYVERINSAREAGDIASAQKSEEALAKLTNPRPRKETDFAPRVAALEAEVAKVRLDYEKLRAQSPPMTPEDRVRLEKRRDDLEKQYDAAASDWDRKLDEARAALAAAQSAEANEAKTLAGNQDRRVLIDTNLAEHDADRISAARKDQIRRLAGRWFGLKPENVTEAQAGLVAAVWYGSLAALAALAGPVTAVVALGLQRIAAEAESRKEGRLSRLMRRMLLQWRWRRVRTVKMPVEVPVDREVEKRVEVPVEKVIKEILYVPVLTDDPEALRRALGRELPPEIANLVKVSSRSGTQRTDEADRAIEEAFQDDLQLDLDEPVKTRAKRGGKRARPA